MSGERYAAAGRLWFAARRRPENEPKAEVAREAMSTAAMQAVEKPAPWEPCEECEASGHPPSPQKPAASK